LISLFYPVPFAASSSSILHPDDSVHGRAEEQAFETTSVEVVCIRRRAIRFLGSVSARLLAAVSAILRRFDCFLDKSNYTMGDINDSDGGVAGATFSVAMYVFFLSYLALLLVPCLDLMHVLSLMYVVKYACVSVMLLSVIKLTPKLSNNLTSYC
jgi:hypothetical protein